MINKQTIKNSILLGGFLLMCASFASNTTENTNKLPQVLIKTNLGDITIELDNVNAPNTTKNFLDYVNSGFYNGTIFHRIISTFMIQGGGYTPDFNKKATNAPIQNEANNGLTNERGTIAMARTGEPHSATCQFFINVANNAALNYTNSQSSRGWGYAVFGKVVAGMDVVDKIKDVATGPKGPFSKDAPVDDVIIESVAVINNTKSESAPEQDKPAESNTAE